jgi:hypothetical protein
MIREAGHASGRSDLVDIAGELRADRERSIQFFDGSKTVWLPKSQIEVEKTGPNNFVTVTMPEWLALEKGLI